MASTAASGDVDCDGDLDIMIANAGFSGCLAGQNQLYINDGAGGFVDSTFGDTAFMPDFCDQSFGLALGDFDGDGDLDAFVANGLFAFEENENRMLLNNGAGGFRDGTLDPPRRLPLQGGSAVAEAQAGDIDGDGDLDILKLCVYPFDSQLLINRGDARFVNEYAQRIPRNMAEGSWICVELGDVDSDGDLDIVRAGTTFSPQLLINDGTGHFAHAGDAVGADLPDLAGRISAYDCELGDFDGDQDLDIVLVSNNIIGGAPGALPYDRLLINDGTGRFTDGTLGPRTGLPLIAEPAWSVTSGDVDSDGDIDIVIGMTYRGRDRLYLNDGHGFFVDATDSRGSGLPDVRITNVTVLLADFDREGDLDLFMTRGGPASSPHVVLFNR